MAGKTEFLLHAFQQGLGIPRVGIVAAQARVESGIFLLFVKLREWRMAVRTSTALLSKGYSEFTLWTCARASALSFLGEVTSLAGPVSQRFV